ncbi:MutS-related protein [Pareuzebyella sediminis]|uniref:MutS-related protein n=1 Tax=Pareuzebyella sediminis TaxID=2607998 RepID=UPI0011EE0FD8|nr:DNA mismatch repair protein MutS [Pareuzebyella sediminis]
MEKPTSFYQEQLQKHASSLEAIKRKLFASSMVRLMVFCAAAFGVYMLFGNLKWVVAIILLAVALFLYLVSRHSDLLYERERLRALHQINRTELKVLEHEFFELPEGNEFKDPMHHFSQDVDLFGRGSFYQYANRTALKQGAETFAGLLKENHIDHIAQKQEAIKELAGMPEWRQNFSAIALLVQTETDTEKIIGWLNRYTSFLPKSMRFVPWIFSAGTIALFTVYFTFEIPDASLIFWLFFGLGITTLYIKKIMLLGNEASKMQSTFQQYNRLLSQLEATEFESAYLKDLKQTILGESEKTSTVIKRFSRALNSIDKNNNMLYAFFANGLFLRSLTHSRTIEQWIEQYGSAVEGWFATIAHFDAYNSLGNFAFNHPDYTFPILGDDDVVLKAMGAGHPLLKPDKCVLNDFEIDRQQFFIVTGANMAGKSTFLRTVSLQIVMANVGLPVYAQQVHYTPIKLITSMRTTDSLTDDESYFFSELKRLKFIVDEIQKDRYFIVLDEILKGTNSTDKAKGSRKFIERLVASKATGIIATHDLSLCEVADEFPQIENHYFDAEIINDELHFDYKFKRGVCQNMNASFLLRKMQIV